MWWIVVTVALQLRSSYAQLTPQGEAVCVGKQVVLVCQREFFTRWSVFLSEDQQATYELRVLSSQAGSVLNFQNDTSFGFEIHVLTSTSSSNTTVLTELRVTAVRQLNGVTVECRGGNGNDRSTIQIASVNPPAAPSGVMTTADQSQFTPSTASITLTWSASSEADNYTIMVTPLLQSGQSLVSTNTTSLQLTVLYNEEYTINITAQNCAGSNSTIELLIVVGCSPPSPLANGRISEYSSGAVGAMLTFQCDTGYMPQDEVTSTCLSNSSWVPIPECQVDCGVPLRNSGVIIDPFNNTKFGALIIFHCEEAIISMCGSDGEWNPDPASMRCPKSECSGNRDTFSTGSQVFIAIIIIIICSLFFFLLGVFLGALSYHCAVARYKHNFNFTSSSSATPATLAPVLYEETLPYSHREKKSDIELNENVAYGPVTIK